MAKGLNLIVLSAVLAASLTQTGLPDQAVAAAPQPEAAAPVNPAPPPAPATPPSTTPPSTTPASTTPDSAATTVASTPDTAPAVAKPDQTPPAKPATSEIVVSGQQRMKRLDPVEGINKVSFQAIEGVDKALIGPVIHVYRDRIPGPIRQGLHNFFFNLTEPVNAVNYVLQLHPGKALKTVARFGINSTVGVGGLIDVAKKKPFNIYYRPNGFGNTFGYWGIGPGPYLFLPLVGPTNVRDLIGSLLDQAALPAVVKPLNNYYYVLAAGVITELDYRVDIDAGVERVRKTSNVYASYRQAYMKARFEEIEALHGRGPLAKGEIGQPPFVRPLFPEGGAAPAATPSGTTPPAAALVPAPTAAPAPAAPLPPVFIAVPIVEPHAVVQPLPPGYHPGGS